MALNEILAFVNNDTEKPLNKLIEDFKNDAAGKLDSLVQSKNNVEHIIIGEQKYQIIREDKWENIGSSTGSSGRGIRFVGRHFFLEDIYSNYRIMAADNVELKMIYYSPQDANDSAVACYRDGYIYLYYVSGSSFTSTSFQGSEPLLIDDTHLLYRNGSGDTVLYNFKTRTTIASSSNRYYSPLIKYIKNDLLYIATNSEICIFNYPSLTNFNRISCVGGSASKYMRFLEDNGKIYYVSNDGQNIRNISDNKSYNISSLPRDISSVYHIEITGHLMVIYSKSTIYLCDLENQQVISTKNNNDGNITLYINNFKDNTFAYFSGEKSPNSSNKEYVNYAYRYNPKYTLKKVVQ